MRSLFHMITPQEAKKKMQLIKSLCCRIIWSTKYADLIVWTSDWMRIGVQRHWWAEERRREDLINSKDLKRGSKGVGVFTSEARWVGWRSLMHAHEPTTSHKDSRLWGRFAPAAGRSLDVLLSAVSRNRSQVSQHLPAALSGSYMRGGVHQMQTLKLTSVILASSVLKHCSSNLKMWGWNPKWQRSSYIFLLMSLQKY